jgi:hypothetical protein
MMGKSLRMEAIMGSRIKDRKEKQELAAIEIHRLAGNIGESTSSYNCDNTQWEPRHGKCL